LVAGVWYHLVCTCDGSSYHFYVNAQEVGTGIAVQGGGNTGVSAPLTLGCNPPAYTLGGGDQLAEQLKGRLDEVAIYPYALSVSQIWAHWGGPQPAGPAVLSTAGLGSTQVQFDVTGAPDSGFSVLVSSNLMDWEYLGPGTNLAPVSDTGASNASRRFYRLRWP
jgi:hypothetical protein